jgi:hypothetical protein
MVRFIPPAVFLYPYPCDTESYHTVAGQRQAERSAVYINDTVKTEAPGNFLRITFRKNYIVVIGKHEGILSKSARRNKVISAFFSLYVCLVRLKEKDK